MCQPYIESTTILSDMATFPLSLTFIYKCFVICEVMFFQSVLTSPSRFPLSVIIGTF